MRHDKHSKKSAKANEKHPKQKNKALQGLNAIRETSSASPKDKAAATKSPILGLKHAIEAAQVAELSRQVAALGGG